MMLRLRRDVLSWTGLESPKLFSLEPLLPRNSSLLTLARLSEKSSLSLVMVSMTPLPLRRPISVLLWVVDPKSPRTLEI